MRTSLYKAVGSKMSKRRL